MATQKFFILDNPEPHSDGVIKSKNKVDLGLAWENEGPTTKYITCELKGYWIINEAEFTKLKTK